jgi:hypothetical protein
MSANGIAHLPTREERQVAKLALAAAKRAADGNPRATLDITLLPTQFDGNDTIDNPNTGGLIEGRPWIATVSNFTFYEAINTTSALSTTQYVLGNKIYAYSSSYDVPSYQNARVVSNDIELLNVNTRGHHLVVLDPLGDLISATRFDTYIDPANLTALATALGAVSSGNIAVLVTYDACAFNAACRSALTTGYGCTNSNTWTASRHDHIFIGVKI